MKCNCSILLLSFSFFISDFFWFSIAKEFSDWVCYSILFIVRHMHCNYTILNSISKRLYCFKLCEIIHFVICFVDFQKIVKILKLQLVFSVIVNCFSLFASMLFNCLCLFFKNFSLRQIYTHKACSIIWLWFKGNISSPVRYSYLLILPHSNAVIFLLLYIIY